MREAVRAFPCVVVSIWHGPRAAQRLLSTVGGRGHVIRSFRYTPTRDTERVLAIILVEASADVAKLAAQVEQMVAVDWCRPLESIASRSDGRSSLEVDRFTVTVSGGAGGDCRHEAVVAARVGQRRQLGAGEGDNLLTALASAFMSLPLVAESESPPKELTVETELLPLDRSLARARLEDGAGVRDVVRIGSNPTATAVGALAAACSQIVGMGGPQPVSDDHVAWRVREGPQEWMSASAEQA